MSRNVSSELDFTSQSFDPVKALKCRNIYMPFPKAKTYNNLADWYNHTFGKKKKCGVSKKASKNECFVLRRNYEWFYETLGLDVPEDFDVKNRYLKCLTKKKRNSFGKYLVDDTLVVKEMPSEMLQPMRSSKIIVKRSNGTVRKYVYPSNNKNKLEETSENSFEENCEANEEKSILPSTEIFEDDKISVKKSGMSSNNVTKSVNHDLNHKITNCYRNTESNLKNETSNSQVIQEIHNPVQMDPLSKSDNHNRTPILNESADAFDVLSNGVNHAQNNVFPDNDKFISSGKKRKENVEKSEISSVMAAFSRHQHQNHENRNTTSCNKPIKIKTNSEVIGEEKQCSVQTDLQLQNLDCHVLNTKSSNLINTTCNALKPTEEKNGRSNTKKDSLVKPLDKIGSNFIKRSDNKNQNHEIENTNYKIPNTHVIIEKKRVLIQKDLNSERENYKHNCTPSLKFNSMNTLCNVLMTDSEIKNNCMISTKNNNGYDTGNEISEKPCHKTGSNSKEKSPKILDSHEQNQDIKNVNCKQSKKRKTNSKVITREKKQCLDQNAELKNFNHNHILSTKSNLINNVSEKSCTQVKVKNVIGTGDKNGCEETEFISQEKSVMISDNQSQNDKNRNINFKIPLKHKTSNNIITNEKKQCLAQKNRNSELKNFNYNPSLITKSASLNTSYSVLKPASEKSCAQAKVKDMLSTGNKNGFDTKNFTSVKSNSETESNSKENSVKISDNQYQNDRNRNINFKIPLKHKTNTERKQSLVQKDPNSELENFNRNHTSSIKSNSINGVLKPISENSCIQVKVKNMISSTGNKNICDAGNNASEKPIDETECNSKEKSVKISDNHYQNDKKRNTKLKIPLRYKTNIDAITERRKQSLVQKDLNSELENLNLSHTSNTNSANGILKAVSEKSCTQAKVRNMTINKNNVSEKPCDKTECNSREKSLKTSNNKYQNDKNRNTDFKMLMKRKINTEVSERKKSCLVQNNRCQTLSTKSNSINDIFKPVSKKSCALVKVRNMTSTAILEKLYDETESHSKEKSVETSGIQYQNHNNRNTNCNRSKEHGTNTETITGRKKQCLVEKDLNSELENFNHSHAPNTKSNSMNVLCSTMKSVSEKSCTEVKNMINSETKNEYYTSKTCNKTESNPKEKLIVISANQYQNHIRNIDHNRSTKYKTNADAIPQKNQCSARKDINSELENCDPNLALSTISSNSGNTLCNVLKPVTDESCARAKMDDTNTVNMSQCSASEKLYGEIEFNSKEKSLLELARKARNKLRSQT